MATLDRLKQLDRPIQVAINGMGAMGKGLFYQCHITPGIRCAAIADIKIERAIACAEQLSCRYRVVDDLNSLDRALAENVIAVCSDGDLLARCETVDALIESSNSISAAARFAITALEHRKHLILMNSEIDLVFGPYLMQLARKNQLVYTSCDGDQHGVLKHLIDEIQLWGFDLVMAGNIKGFLDRYSNPLKIIPEANKRNLDYKMATAYTDGTKLCIEMALLANACGLAVTVPGMRGPRARDVHEVLELFDLDALWKTRQPVAEYILGAEPNGGVYVIGYCDHPYQQSMLAYYKMGNGPFYLFYRPYHLCHIEAIECIAAACLDRVSLLAPRAGFRTNVFAYAKRPLTQGHKLDGLGGFDCYGLIENVATEQADSGLPIALAENAILTRDIAQDRKIYFADVRLERDRFGLELYRKALAVSSERAA